MRVGDHCVFPHTLCLQGTDSCRGLSWQSQRAGHTPRWRPLCCLFLRGDFHPRGLSLSYPGTRALRIPQWDWCGPGGMGRLCSLFSVLWNVLPPPRPCSGGYPLPQRPRCQLGCSFWTGLKQAPFISVSLGWLPAPTHMSLQLCLETWEPLTEL